MRPLEKSKLDSVINSIAPYINGRSYQLQNRIFVTESVMYLPLEELLILLRKNIKSEDSGVAVVHDNKTFIISETSVLEKNDDNPKSLSYVVKKVGSITYVEAAFWMECLNVTLAWEPETLSLYICTKVHYDGYLLAPDIIFEKEKNVDELHGLFMFLDGEVDSLDNGSVIVNTQNGKIVLQSRLSSIDNGKRQRFCFAFSKNRDIYGTPQGRLMELVEIDDSYRIGYMIYTKESYDSFKDFSTDVKDKNVVRTNILGFDQDRLISMFIQYPDVLKDRRRLSSILGDMFPENKRNINLFLIAYDCNIAEKIKENELDDAFVYRVIKTLMDDYGIQMEYATETVCLWCHTYGNGVLNKVFVSKRKYLPEVQKILTERSSEWHDPRLTHPKAIGELLYFEPLDWRRKSASGSYDGVYYYPYANNEALIWVSKLKNIAYGEAESFNYNPLVIGMCDDDCKNILASNDITVAGIRGKRFCIKKNIAGNEYEMDVCIIPTSETIYTFTFGEKDGLSSPMVNYEQDFLERVKRTSNSNTDKIVVKSAEEFEKRLNDGENLDGSIVTFKVIKVCEDINMVLGGYNLWAGEHLNFISKKPMNVSEGDLLTVNVSFVNKTPLGSWAVYYEHPDVDTEGEWSDCSDDEVVEIISKIVNEHKKESMIDGGCEDEETDLKAERDSSDIKHEVFKSGYDISENRLTKEIRKFVRNGNVDSSGTFVETVRDMLKNKDWVQFPCREETNTLMVVEMSGRPFFVMFSEGKFMKTGKGVSIIATDINKLFDAAEESDVAGIAINPFTPDCHCEIEKDKFHFFR